MLNLCFLFKRVAAATAMSNNGRGQYRKLARELGVSSVIVSQVFNGERELSLEQALSVTQFFGLTPLERDYFLVLVQRNRAATPALKKVLDEQLTKIVEQASQLKSRFYKTKKLDEAINSQFYTNWYYTAISLAVTIPQFNTIDKISKFLDIPVSRVNQIIQFLCQYGFCVEEEGRLHAGPIHTHLEPTSPLVTRHHLNWRVKAFERMDKAQTRDLFFTSPMALSRSAAESIRRDLLDAIDRATETAVKSDSETLACLNIDWFGVS